MSATKNGKIFKLAQCKQNDLEMWARWDADVEVFELTASEDGNDYVGDADNLTEAKKVAREWFNEWKITTDQVRKG